MDHYIDDLFFTNVFITEEIKTENILKTIDSGIVNQKDTELSFDNYISTIEKINDKTQLNVNNFIEFFLIFEKEKCLNTTKTITEIKQNIKKLIFQMYKSQGQEMYIDDLVNEFHKLVYLNILHFDKVLKYDLRHSLIKFFDSIKNDRNIFLTKHGSDFCFICTDKISINKLLCCNNIICFRCFNNTSSCPYCNFDFKTKLEIQDIEFKNFNELL